MIDVKTHLAERPAPWSTHRPQESNSEALPSTSLQRLGCEGRNVDPIAGPLRG
ncbi:hypothetical protein ACFOLD_09305 [Kocuria carniphila]|uniref:hypothetical protein n=1 Tax=Kocuria carniphila TaxID=262208 RepID=UPI00360BD445